MSKSETSYARPQAAELIRRLLLRKPGENRGLVRARPILASCRL